jgi:hypothetical protein
MAGASEAICGRYQTSIFFALVFIISWYPWYTGGMATAHTAIVSWIGRKGASVVVRPPVTEGVIDSPRFGAEMLL